MKDCLVKTQHCPPMAKEKEKICNSEIMTVTSQDGKTKRYQIKSITKDILLNSYSVEAYLIKESDNGTIKRKIYTNK